VEKANRIFKARLFACQVEARARLSDWVRFLPEIAFCVNTTWPSSLLAYVTPFFVWFGREPHWLGLQGQHISNDVGNDNENKDTGDNKNKDTSNNNSDPEYPETDSEAKGFILSLIKQRIKASNAIVAKKMVQKSKKKGTTFQEGVLVTLAILAKQRLSLEPKRLLCRVISCA